MVTVRIHANSPRIYLHLCTSVMWFNLQRKYMLSWQHKYRHEKPTGFCISYSVFTVLGQVASVTRTWGSLLQAHATAKLLHVRETSRQAATNDEMPRRNPAWPLLSPPNLALDPNTHLHILGSRKTTLHLHILIPVMWESPSPLGLFIRFSPEPALDASLKKTCCLSF